MLFIARAAVPRIRTATRSFVTSCHNRTDIQRPQLPPLHVRHYQYQAIATHAFPSKSKWRYLRRGITALAYIFALYGLYRLCDPFYLHVHLAFVPIYFRRLKRAIARDVNAEDLDDAMDYFCYVFHCTFSPRLGLDRELPESLVYTLESASDWAQELGPEVAGGLLDLVKEAFSEIRSFEVMTIDSDAEFLHEFMLLLFKHVTAFARYLQPHMAEHKEVKEAANAEMKIEWIDSSGDDSID